jgi:hypothetical protein
VWSDGRREYDSDNLSRVGHIPPMHSLQLEGLAAEKLDEISAPETVCAFELADSCSLELTPVSRYEESFDGLEIRFPFRYATHLEQQAFVARCVAICLLTSAGFFVNESAIAQLARALMLRRKPFVRDYNRCGGDIRQLRKLYPNASMAMLGARIGDVAATRDQLTG